ncbi:hypothetical protein ABZ671_04905 [Micromonospora sp. NPDC006766]|uniref:MmyB family transcriptional regulator n=1 Tax=Micromonospora sp. NPDC006766 TaxID=3154778 RepID=UPI0033ED2072
MVSLGSADPSARMMPALLTNTFSRPYSRSTSPAAVRRAVAEHEVGERRPTVKRVDHPKLSLLEFECRVLHVPETDQRLIVYVPEPGSPTQTPFDGPASTSAP